MDVIVQQQQFFMTSQRPGIEQNLDIHDRVKCSSITWKQILLVLKQKECMKG